MSRKCEICGKSPQFGNQVSHSNRKTKTKRYVNLQSVNIILNGKKKKVRVCTSCIKSNKIQKAA